MGIRDWFARKPSGLSEVRAPSPEYPPPAAAIDSAFAHGLGLGSTYTLSAGREE